jgi:hypothetical protein
VANLTGKGNAFCLILRGLIPPYEVLRAGIRHFPSFYALVQHFLTEVWTMRDFSGSDVRKKKGRGV